MYVPNDLLFPVIAVIHLKKTKIGDLHDEQHCQAP